MRNEFTCWKSWFFFVSFLFCFFFFTPITNSWLEMRHLICFLCKNSPFHSQLISSSSSLHSIASILTFIQSHRKALPPRPPSSPLSILSLYPLWFLCSPFQFSPLSLWGCSVNDFALFTRQRTCVSRKQAERRRDGGTQTENWGRF